MPKALIVNVVMFVVNSTRCSRTARATARASRVCSPPLIGGLVVRDRHPRSGVSQLSPHRRVEGAAVEQEVLADDKAGRGGAQKRARVAKFRRIADPAGRVRLPALGEHLLKGDVLPPRLVLDA